MDWTASACSATACSRPTEQNQKQTITLVESENGGSWKPGGDALKGVAHDHFSVEPRTINQHWFVDGQRVQLVVGKDSKGNLIDQDLGSQSSHQELRRSPSVLCGSLVLRPKGKWEIKEVM